MSVGWGGWVQICMVGWMGAGLYGGVDGCRSVGWGCL